jgi:hypothetical protein
VSWTMSCLLGGYTCYNPSADAVKRLSSAHQDGWTAIQARGKPPLVMQAAGLCTERAH